MLVTTDEIELPDKSLRVITTFVKPLPSASKADPDTEPLTI